MTLNITLYSTNCPQCVFLERALKEKGIEPVIVQDVEEIIKLGYNAVPVLRVDDTVMSFQQALAWVKDYPDVNK